MEGSLAAWPRADLSLHLPPVPLYLVHGVGIPEPWHPKWGGAPLVGPQCCPHLFPGSRWGGGPHGPPWVRLWLPPLVNQG